MKTRKYTTLLALFITLTLTTSSIAQNPPGRQMRGPFYDVEYSPDGTKIAIADSFNIWFFNAQTGRELQRINAKPVSAFSIAFSPDGKTLASGGYDCAVRLWDAVNLDTGVSLRILRGHKRPISSVAFSPDGRILASGSWDKTVRLWDTDTGKILHTLKGHTEGVWCVAFSPDGKTIAVGHWGGVQLWDVNTGERLRELSQHRIDKADTATVYSMAFSPDGKAIVTGGTDALIRLWDVDTGQYRRLMNQRQISKIPSIYYKTAQKNLRTNVTNVLRYAWLCDVVFSADGSTFATTSMGITTLWDADTKEELRMLNRRDRMSRIDRLALSPDGSMIAVVYPHGVHLWDAATGQFLRVLISRI